MSFEFVAVSRLPTPFGTFDLSVFVDQQTGQEHAMLSMGLPISAMPASLIVEPVLVRLHSECLTGDAFSSLRCDCGPQLRATQQMIGDTGRGVILYLRQEGRGIGLVNKIRAYALQDQGHDTLDANLLLGLPADARTYEMCGVMLRQAGIQNIELLTNNPLKLQALQEQGFNIVDRRPLQVGVNRHNQHYLETKQERMGHLLPDLTRANST